MKKIIIATLVYVISVNGIAIHRLNDVNKYKYDLQVAIDRNNDIVNKSIEVLNEASKYNIYMIDKSDKVLLNLNKKLEDYQEEQIGSKNRIAVAKYRLSESIKKYNNVAGNIICIPVMIVFGFEKIEFDNVKNPQVGENTLSLLSLKERVKK